MFSKIKKYFATAIIVLAVVAILTVSSTGMFAGDLGCDDLSNCSGKATCGSSGTLVGCEITCSGGGTVTCDAVSNG